MPRHHPIPLHHLLADFPRVNPNTLEKVKAVRHHPRARLPFKTLISLADNATDNLTGADITIYTDGSAIDGGVGIVAYLTKPSRPPCSLQYHLDLTNKYMVYSVKCTGLVLGAHLLQSERSQLKKVVSPQIARWPSLSHYLLNAFEKQLRALQHKHDNLKITIAWIQGTETFKAMKRQTTLPKGTSSLLYRLPQMLRKVPSCKAMIKLTLSHKLQARANKWWHASP
jgi:hypothetical protein